MNYAYFDHDADIGIIGCGETIEAAFVAAAQAMFAIMAEPPNIQGLFAVPIEFEESDAELALATWLNALLAEARSRNMIFCRFRLGRQGNHWSGEAWGEPWRDTLEPGVEVKGATLTMLSVRQRDTGWEARCVVDV